MKVIRIMKKYILFLISAALLCSCSDRVDVVFDTPFVSISDEAELNSTMMVDKEANNLLTSLTVRLCVSNHFFTEPITVKYEMEADGLTEGVDFKVQPNTKSPLTFDPGNYTAPIRIIWMKNPDFDPDKKNTLTITLTWASIPEMVLGYPGPDALRSTFTFTKK